MYMKEKEFTVKLGGMTFKNVEVIMTFAGQPLFTVYRSESDGSVGISFEIFDSHCIKIASIKQNRIYPHHEHAKGLAGC